MLDACDQPQVNELLFGRYTYLKKLVEEACIPGSPQCFLLTPKLLPSLHYSDEVTVLNIFNGPFLNLSGEFRFL